ncbi:hypothetical protein LOD99_14504 [Oopsacas minuta]|uniref:Integrase catalytic domain-containing protein n=1 Tax=Oopsacas minuta TaxID=111878 RepID=A0AAV7KEW7_9METZ|nr:hypothetical protein LOD99_14504 [Oopsacas minuta]
MTATIPKSTKKLQPIQPPSRTWKHLGMDLICDLPMFQEFHCKLHIDNRSTRAYHPMANGLVEAHNKILKTKLTKMEVQTGNHWSQLLKLACLTMNSTKKKSHGQTPFNVKEILSQQSENDYIDDQDEFSPPCSEPGEELSCIYETRDTRFKSAAEDIHSEQLRQKLQYDKKVNTKGSSIKIGAKKNKNIPIDLVRLYAERKPKSLRQANPMGINHISSKILQRKLYGFLEKEYFITSIISR